jgi:16S rRNA C967 or C1407 C5-methylase (RsmB/RsmF family)
MVRQLAWEVLRSGSATPLREVDIAAEQLGLDPRDRGLLRRIIGTEVRHRAALRALVNKFARGNPSADIRAHLHVAFAQIFFMNRVPQRAAVSEAGDATRRTLGGSKVPLVNAILRTSIRERIPGAIGDPMCDIYGTDWHFAEALFPDPDKHPLLWIEEALSIPSALAKRWVKRHGFERTVELAKYFSAEPCLSLRVLGDRDAVRAELEQHLAAAEAELEALAAAAALEAQAAEDAPEVQAPIGSPYGNALGDANKAKPTEGAPKPKPDAPSAPTRLMDGQHGQFLLVEGGNYGTLFQAAAFTEGRVTVQGESAYRAAELLQVQPGEAILDLCAAPGGKTSVFGAAGAKVVACDVSEYKLRRLGETVERLGLGDNVECIQLDAETEPSDAALGDRTFDGVFVDAPCSNTGVLGARPGARWRFGKANQTSLRELQAKLIAQGGARVRPGGRLVWSTCSLEGDENAQQVKVFLEANPTWTLEEEISALPKWGSHGGPIDGGYAARLRRGE